MDQGRAVKIGGRCGNSIHALPTAAEHVLSLPSMPSVPHRRLRLPAPQPVSLRCAPAQKSAHGPRHLSHKVTRLGKSAFPGMIHAPHACAFTVTHTFTVFYCHARTQKAIYNKKEEFRTGYPS